MCICLRLCLSGETVGLGREETVTEEWVSEIEGSVKQGLRGHCDRGIVTVRAL